MRAPIALEPALKAVLGAQMDAVIVESPQFALRAIEILKENRAGRMTSCRNRRRNRSASCDRRARHRRTPARDARNRIALLAVAEAMLGHVMLADDLRSALAASNLNATERSS